MDKEFAVNKDIKGNEIRRFRENYGLNRREFASLLNISNRTLEKWEAENESISGPVVFLLTILNEKSDLLSYYIIPEKKYPLRLYYMNAYKINTVIDVDILNRRVSFKNYTNNLLNRAFGASESVDYEEYERFLESRCFPRSRDKIKAELEHLGIRNYDPLAIIRKTNGRMAEDDCYIVIEDNNG